MDSHQFDNNADSSSDLTTQEFHTAHPFHTIHPFRARTKTLASRWPAAFVALATLALPLAVAFADPSPRPPRPTMTGHIGQGSAPCSNLPSDLATLRVTLIKENGSGVCDSGDTEILANVAPSWSGNYAIPAATGEPGWQGAGSYCIGVIRASLATPAPIGAIEPGTYYTTSYAVDAICVP